MPTKMNSREKDVYSRAEAKVKAAEFLSPECTEVFLRPLLL